MSIPVTQLYRKLQQGEVTHLVDVRTTAEFHSEHFDVQPLLNHPLDQIDSLDLPKDAEIYLTCRTGNRSGKALACLQKLGYTNLVNVEGGFLAWQAAKLPVTKTGNVFPVLRQVQIAAGILVMLGALGSLYITPALIWLAVFIGAGLAFSGLTGTCGMAMLLARMPWNKAMQSQEA